MAIDRNELSEEIMRFLDAHGLSSANYDPEYDEPGDRYSSPDASELHGVAELLSMGERKPPRVPWSSWGSGGYGPYTDKAAREWHDSIMEKIKEYRLDVGSTPPSP